MKGGGVGEIGIFADAGFDTFRADEFNIFVDFRLCSCGYSSGVFCDSSGNTFLFSFRHEGGETRRRCFRRSR